MKMRAQKQERINLFLYSISNYKIVASVPIYSNLYIAFAV